MDIISGLFLVFSGLALGLYTGYSLFFRDRSEDEQRHRETLQENQELRVSLKLAHGSHQKIEKNFDKQTGQLKTLQQLCDDWAASRQQADQERGELEEAVRLKSQRVKELHSELQSEKKSRLKLEDSKHSLHQNFTEKQALIDEAWRKQQAKTDNTINQLTADLNNAVDQKQQLVNRLGSAESQVAELQAELDNQRTLLATATNNAQGLEQEYVSLESLLQDSSDQLKSALSKAAATESAKAAVEGSLAALEREHQKLRDENIQLQDQVIELEALQPQIDSLNESLATNGQRLESVVNQRDQAIAAESSAQAIIAGLQKRLDNQESTIHRLRTKYDQSMEDLKFELARVSDLEAELTESDSQIEVLSEKASTIAQLTAQRDQFAEQLQAAEQESTTLAGRLQDEVTALETEQQELKQQYDRSLEQSQQQTLQLTGQRDALASQLSVSQEETSRVLADHQQKLDTLANESDQLQQRYDTVCTESETLAKQCQELTDLCGQRDQQVAEFQVERDELSQRIGALIDQRDQMADKLKVAQQQLNAAHSELQETQVAVADLAKQVDSLKATSLRVVELEALVKPHEQQRNQWSNQLEQLRNRAAAEKQSLVEAHESERQQLTNQLEQLKADLSTENQSLADTHAHQRVQLLKQLGQLETVKADTLAKSQQLAAKLDKVETEKAVSLADNQSLRVKLNDLQTAHEQAVATNEVLEAKLDQLQTQRDGQLLAVSRQDSQVQALQAKLKASEATIRSLRKERAAVLARLANYRTIAEPNAKVISFTEAMELRNQQDQSYEHEYGGPVRRHATRGLIYTQRPKQTDDLKRISGIAEVLEARLNDYGVYTFKQIMQWTPAAIEEFSHLLTFKDRIERDGWIRQAKHFYEEKQRSGSSYAA